MSKYQRKKDIVKAKEYCGTDIKSHHKATVHNTAGTRRSIPEAELDTLGQEDYNSGNKLDLKIPEPLINEATLSRSNHFTI